MRQLMLFHTVTDVSFGGDWLYGFYAIITNTFFPIDEEGKIGFSKPLGHCVSCCKVKSRDTDPLFEIFSQYGDFGVAANG